MVKPPTVMLHKKKKTYVPTHTGTRRGLANSNPPWQVNKVVMETSQGKVYTQQVDSSYQESWTKVWELSWSARWMKGVWIVWVNTHAWELHPSYYLQSLKVMYLKLSPWEVSPKTQQVHNKACKIWQVDSWRWTMLEQVNAILEPQCLEWREEARRNNATK